MVVRSPGEFAAAVRAHAFGGQALDRGAVARARQSLAAAGLLVVGEPHGVRETPGVLLSLARALGTRAVAFEWSWEELNEPVQAFVAGGAFEFERIWSIPPSAEFFSGDGRVTAGHFALLERLRTEGRLEQAILIDRLDPVPPPEPRARERALADRLLREWDGARPLLVLVGAGHALLDAGETMASCLARRRPALEPVLLAYARGHGWFHGPYEVSPPPVSRATVLRLPLATPAVVPVAGGRSDA